MDRVATGLTLLRKGLSAELPLSGAFVGPWHAFSTPHRLLGIHHLVGTHGRAGTPVNDIIARGKWLAKRRFLVNEPRDGQVRVVNFINLVLLHVGHMRYTFI